MIVVDTGPLVAAFLDDDDHHARCVELFTAAHTRHQALIVPAFVAAETCYMVARFAGSRAESAFLRSLRDGGAFTLLPPASADVERAAELVDQYADLPLGAVDASVVATAERLKVTEVATLDVRHFHVVRPRHVPAFALLPR